jgi:SAM-dependent methyltransferase
MEWWRDMFTLPSWQAVQFAWDRADDVDEDVHHVWHALGLSPGARVLDVPCGTGRIATHLRARGCTVIGIDVTDAFVRAARAAGVPAIRGDMRTQLVRSASFDAVLCWWGSFGYFDEDGNLAQAEAAAAALVPGGRVLIDTVVADSVLTEFTPEVDWEVGDVHVHESRTYDEAERRIVDTWTFTRNGVEETQTTSVRAYTVVELMELLSDVGFVSFQTLDEDLRPFQPAADRLRLVATMPDD